MLISSAGNSFTVGGNHRIPIEDNGDVKMKSRTLIKKKEKSTCYMQHS
ncbi:hypothetical protein L917_03647 [Phytophthora nicotianae]|uniref:Uncharacterized protein n=1 Tax=Phytophthora nicotianae TaxID=4792 RepID=W2LS50_PHYNI|nr:hypothetical protein L917_03647 [Phytophthora nicotianae]